MRPGSGHLADVVLVLHALVVLFNVGAVPVIWAGYFRGWRFVRNFYFRFIHLALIGIVAAESLFGVVCPLTAWEEALRGGRLHDSGFVAYWVHQLLFYDCPNWVFTVAYLLFFFVVIATFHIVRPEMPTRRPRCG